MNRLRRPVHWSTAGFTPAISSPKIQTATCGSEAARKKSSFAVGANVSSQEAKAIFYQHVGDGKPAASALLTRSTASVSRQAVTAETPVAFDPQRSFDHGLDRD